MKPPTVADEHVTEGQFRHAGHIIRNMPSVAASAVIHLKYVEWKACHSSAANAVIYSRISSYFLRWQSAVSFLLNANEHILRKKTMNSACVDITSWRQFFQSFNMSLQNCSRVPLLYEAFGASLWKPFTAGTQETLGTLHGDALNSARLIYKLSFSWLNILILREPLSNKLTRCLLSFFKCIPVTIIIVASCKGDARSRSCFPTLLFIINVFIYKVPFKAL